MIALLPALFLALGAFPSLAAAACDTGEIVIKFSHVANAELHPKGIAANLLAARVNDELDGRACMEVYPDAILHNDEESLKALLDGDLQMAAPSLSKFETYTKKFRLFDLPFLFDDIDAVQRYQASPDGRDLLLAIADQGLLGLAYWQNGMKQMSADKPLIAPEDARGLTFRIQDSEVIAAQFRRLGAVPKRMVFSKLRGALEDGIVDGQENTWSNIYGRRFFELQDGTTETHHGLLGYMVVVPTVWWNHLDPHLKRDFLTILLEVGRFRNREAARVNDRARQAILNAGGVIRELSPAQRRLWVETMKPVWKQFQDQIGADIIAAARSYNHR